jgi:CBS domain containing-hemolysin-like protein
LRFSRIPVYQKDKDHITGVVLKDDVLSALAEDRHYLLLSEIKREVQFVQDDAPLTNLFDILVERRVHMAVVVDNYGSLVGLVSMEDLFETILGVEITDESDNVENLQRLAREKWQDRARGLGLIEEIESK